MKMVFPSFRPESHRRFVSILWFFGTLLGASSEARAEDPLELKYYVRLSAAGGRTTEQLNVEGADNTSFSLIGATLAFPAQFADRWYFVPGLSAGYSLFEGEACAGERVDNEGTSSCPTALANFTAEGFFYGIDVGLVRKFQPGQPYSLIWMPHLRVNHVIQSHSTDAPDCEQAFGGDACSGWTIDNLLATLTIDFDFVHSFPLGCGISGGVGLYLSDLASDPEANIMVLVSAHFGFGTASTSGG